MGAAPGRIDLGQKRQAEMAKKHVELNFAKETLRQQQQFEQKIGHFPYPEGKAQKMVIIGSYATGAEYQKPEKLASEVAFALM